MIKHRAGMAALVLVAGGLGAGEALGQAASPPSAVVGQLVSDQHRVREQALAQLVSEGATAVPALVTASLSPDPELSWRATEALQVVCQTVDLQGERAVKNMLVKYSRASNHAEAAVARKLLQQWPVLRHHYAAAQLEALGAEVADYPPEQLVPTQGEGLVVPGGAIFGGLMPVDFEGDVVIEDVAEAAVEAEEAPAPEAPRAKAPLFGGIFRALRRAAGELKEADEAVGEAMAERIADRIEAEAERMADRIEAEAEGAADVDFIEEGPAAVPVAVDFGMEGFAILEGGMMMRGGMMWGSSVHSQPVETDQLQPGSLRIGKQWRGGDGGLEYVAGLQQMHTVILRDAPLTDAALARLATIHSLSQLKVVNTKLSGAALLKFRQQRPQVTVTAVGAAVLGVAGSDHPQGLLVQQVTPETGARRAGLDEQDIITKVDGLKVRGINDVMLALYDKQPGGKVKIDYLRRGKQRSAEVVLTARGDTPGETPAGYIPSHSVQTLVTPALLEEFFPADVAADEIVLPE